MPDTLSPSDIAKRAAAHRAADLVRPGMKVGLGTGSTAAFLVARLGQRLRAEALRFTAVATSDRTAEQARGEGIDVVALDEAGPLDLTIDGADEFDPNLTLIKGAGGAHLREKIVAAASDRMVVIADARKEVATLGAFPLPVEVIPFGWQSTRELVCRALGRMDVDARDAVLRERDGDAFVTDEGNHVLDLHLRRIGDARALSAALNAVPGVVENGLFMDMCDSVVIGQEDGSVSLRGRIAAEQG